MNVNLLCGKKTISLELPDTAQLIENKPAKPLASPESAVRDALLYPIGTLPLKEIAQGRKNACIVISDITRPVPNKIILPQFFKPLQRVVLMLKKSPSLLPPECIGLILATNLSP